MFWPFSLALMPIPILIICVAMIFAKRVIMYFSNLWLHYAKKLMQSNDTTEYTPTAEIEKTYKTIRIRANLVFAAGILGIVTPVMAIIAVTFTALTDLF